MVALTITFPFEAAHCLEGHEGNCGRLHGHTYRLEVTVKGPVQANGMVIDFSALKSLVLEAVIKRVDHEYLNELFTFMPTCENLILCFWQNLEEALLPHPSLILEELVLWETPEARARLVRADVERRRQSES